MKYQGGLICFIIKAHPHYTSTEQNKEKCILVVRELSFFWQGDPNLHKSWNEKNCDPLLQQQNFMTPTTLYTLPPKQAKMVLSSSLFEQNKHTEVIL